MQLINCYLNGSISNHCNWEQSPGKGDGDASSKNPLDTLT